MQKPGWKTSEFWLSLAAALLGAFVASGVLPAEHAVMKIAGMALTALASMGYAASRGRKKNGGGGGSGTGGWVRPWMLVLLTVVTFGILGALSGCPAHQSQQGLAYAKAAERTACLVGLVVCQQLPEDSRPRCLSAQKDICAVTPQLLSVWESAVKAAHAAPAPAAAPVPDASVRPAHLRPSW